MSQLPGVAERFSGANSSPVPLLAPIWKASTHPNKQKSDAMADDFM
jgi:hypothetical protein